MDGVPIEKIKFIINELHYNIKMKGTMVFIILQTSCKDDMEIFNIVSGVWVRLCGTGQLPARIGD